MEHGRFAEDPQSVKRLNTIDVEAVGEGSSSTIDDEKYRAPTEEETSTLRKVSDSIPRTAWLLCIVEFAERASYGGITTVFSNFMQFPLPPGGNGAGAPAPGSQNTAGALGRGIGFSVPMGLVFAFLGCTVPIFGGWLADAKIGRFRTILIGVVVCGVAHIIIICGAIPSVLQAGKGMPPFIISALLLAIGAAIFKPVVLPMILDQYSHQKVSPPLLCCCMNDDRDANTPRQPYTKVLRSGEKVVVDPETTVQRITLVSYGLCNLGVFLGIATTHAEKYVGFWLAFLLPGIVFFLLPPLLWYVKKKLIRYPPNGSAWVNMYRVLKTATSQGKSKLWRKGFLDAAKPSVLSNSGMIQITWTDKDVEDIKRTFVACGIFLYFPVYFVNIGGIGSVATSQGATMTTNGAPNDLLGNFGPITILIAVPTLSHVVYPALGRFNIKFGRISRITFGFCLAILSGLFGTLIQWKIYQLSPCGSQATSCGEVASISIWWRVPKVAIGALSECFSNVTALELAYARAPQGMKALVLSLLLFTAALSAALALIISPAIKDPHLIWIWGGPTTALTVQTVIFWYRYRGYNDDEVGHAHCMVNVVHRLM